MWRQRHHAALPRLPLLQQIGLLRLQPRLLRRRLPEPVQRLRRRQRRRRQHRRVRRLTVALRGAAAAPQRRHLSRQGLLHLPRLHRARGRRPPPTRLPAASAPRATSTPGSARGGRVAGAGVARHHGRVAQRAHSTYSWGFCYKPAAGVVTDNATAFFETAIGSWMEPRKWPTRPSCR